MYAIRRLWIIMRILYFITARRVCIARYTLSCGVCLSVCLLHWCITLKQPSSSSTMTSNALDCCLWTLVYEHQTWNIITVFFKGSPHRGRWIEKLRRHAWPGIVSLLALRHSRAGQPFRQCARLFLASRDLSVTADLLVLLIVFYISLLPFCVVLKCNTIASEVVANA